ncbi:MAG: SMP-30/gluconolactonase/LRE family protein [Kofleriaceae bacterium]
MRPRSMVALRLSLIVALIAGCDPGVSNDDIGRPTEPHILRRGIELPGDARGAWWDAETSALYLTEDTHHEIVKWTERTGFTTFAKLPVSGLGGIVRLPDGRFVVTVFGFGTDGSVLVVDGNGAATPIPNLDRSRRRIGLALAPDGALYVSYLAKTGGGQHGGIAQLTLEGNETTIVENLGKPVGVVATANTLYTTDQHQGQLVAYVRADPKHSGVIAKEIADPDLISLLPCGDLVVGTRAGKLYRVSQGGEVTTIAGDFEQVRGTAYDPAGKRLFVIEHSIATSRHQLHILALECPW